MDSELEFLNGFFNYIYYNTYINEVGQVVEQRQQVQRIDNLKLEIYPNEHAPPHFHVKGPDVNATFSIQDCKFLGGTIDSKSKKKVEYFHKSMQRKLVEVWNNLRPDDCPVGKIELPK